MRQLLLGPRGAHRLSRCRLPQLTRGSPAGEDAPPRGRAGRKLSGDSASIEFRYIGPRTNINLRTRKHRRRPLSDSPLHRTRRHGRSLRGVGLTASRASCDQNDPPGPRAKQRRDRAVSPRGEAVARHLPSERLPHPRALLRWDALRSQSLVPQHGVPRRPHPQRTHSPQRSHQARTRLRSPRADRQRTQRCPRERSDSPRPQDQQHHARQRHSRTPSRRHHRLRLSYQRAPSRGRPSRVRWTRNSGLHGARTNEVRRGYISCRRIRARHHPLRDADRLPSQAGRGSLESH